MKKLLAIILALAALVCIMTVSVSAAASSAPFSLEIEAGTYTFGTGTLTVQVVVDGSVEVNGIDLNIKCPEGLSLDARNDIAWNGEIASADMDNDYIGSKVKNFVDGTVYLLFAAAPLSPEVSPIKLSGTIATLTFTVDESKITPDSDLSFIFTKSNISDDNGLLLAPGSDFTVNPDPVKSKVTLTCSTHDYEKKFDENNHWEECKKCGNKTEKTAHESNSLYDCLDGTCKDCGYPMKASASHSPVQMHDANVHWKECSVCGQELESKASHSGGNADCMHEAVCDVCGQPYGGKNSNLHDYGEPEWKWEGYEKATATFTCKRSKEHVHTENAEITSEEVKATCDKNGTITYTAKVTVGGKTYTDTQTDSETLKATGHSWDDGKWDWSADGKTATLTLTCQNNNAHTHQVSGKVESAKGKEPTCTEKGTTKYTAKAEFDSKTYTDTIEIEDVNALGHSADTSKWVTEAGSAQHWRVCERCGVKMDETAVDHTYGSYTQPDADHHSRTCNDCKAVETEKHSGGTATCTKKAVCEDCKVEYGDVDKNNHDGGVGTAWEKSDTEHWHVCNNCKQKVNVGSHEWSDDYRHDADGHWRVCKVCQKEETHADHDKSSALSHDASGHWNACSKCDEKLDFDAHTNATLTPAVEPSKDEDGTKHDGNHAYWYCPDCNRYFLDENGKKVGDFENTDSFVVKYQEDCTDLGHIISVDFNNQYTHVVYCERLCGLIYTEPHTFNQYGFCALCGYKIPGADTLKPEDVVDVVSPVQDTEQITDDKEDEMNAGDSGDNPAEVTPVETPAETNPKTGIAFSVIPAILAAIVLIKRR